MNSPFSHRSFSSTRTLAPAWSTSREAHGSGSHAPSSLPSWNSFRVWAFSVGLIATSPLPSVVVWKPCLPSQARRATSCVPPSCGVASFLPLRSAAELISGLTTSCAPPDAAPAMMLMDSPLLLT